MKSNGLYPEKNRLVTAIAFICSSFSVSYADIIWTDQDFTRPKGQTSFQNQIVQINNQDTVVFEASLPRNIGVLSIEQNTVFTAEGNVEIYSTGSVGAPLLVESAGSAYFKGDLLTENTDPTNIYYVIQINGNGAKMQVDGKTTLTSAYGLYTNTGANIFLNGDTEINAIYEGVAAIGGQIDFKDVLINMNGPVNAAVFAIKAAQQGQVNVDGSLFINMNINSGSDWSYGVSSYQSSVYLKDTHIQFNSNMAGGEVGLYSDNSSNIVVDGDLTILNSDASKAQNYAIFASNNGRVTSDNSVAYIDGNLRATTNGLIDLKMDTGSYWYGKSTLASGGTINIDMKSTTWDMINNSALTNLTANNSAINFKSSSSNFLSLTTQDLSGANNTFVMNTDLGSITAATDVNGERVGIAGTNGDLLVITGNNTATNNKLAVTNKGSSVTQGNEVLQIVSTTAGNQGDFHLASAVEAGGYQYGLRQTTDPTQQGWELYGTGRVSSTAKAAVNSYFNVSYLLTYIDNQTLLQRMGELREGQGDAEGNFWMRAYGGKLNSFGGQKLDGFDMNYAGTQLGIDKRLPLNSGDLYLGLMGSYVKADPDYKAGSGTAKSFSTGGYLTYLDNNGFYIDTLLKYSNVRNKFSVRDTQYNTVEGHTRSHGYGVSFEVGRQFKLGQSNFYIEPQLQLAYQHQNGDKASATNGLEIKMASYDSVLGRASGIVGYKMTESKKLQLNLYAKTGIVQEFAGNTNYRLNGHKEKYSLNGAWFDNGVGINAKINNRHHLYGELDYSTGHRFDKIQASVGYRFQF